MKDARNIIKRPLVTEKSMDGGALGKYTFEVDMKANKIEIARAVEEMFPNIQVKKVNTLHIKGQVRRLRGREGMTAERKKAIVTLQPGQRIEIFEGV